MQDTLQDKKNYPWEGFKKESTYKLRWGILGVSFYGVKIIKIMRGFLLFTNFN